MTDNDEVDDDVDEAEDDAVMPSFEKNDVVEVLQGGLSTPPTFHGDQGRVKGVDIDFDKAEELIEQDPRLRLARSRIDVTRDDKWDGPVYIVSLDGGRVGIYPEYALIRVKNEFEIVEDLDEMETFEDMDFKPATEFMEDEDDEQDEE